MDPITRGSMYYVNLAGTGRYTIELFKNCNARERGSNTAKWVITATKQTTNEMT